MLIWQPDSDHGCPSSSVGKAPDALSLSNQKKDVVMLNVGTPLIPRLVDALNSHDAIQVARYYADDFEGCR